MIPALSPGGRPLYSAESAQFFDRLLTPPASARATLYAALIDALNTGGVWTLLDALYVFAAANSATALINLKSASFQATVINSTGNPTFTVDRGWSGHGAPGSNSIALNFIPSTAGGNYTRNNALFGGWQYGNNIENKHLLTDQNFVDELVTRNSVAGNTVFAVNGGEVFTAMPADGSGLWLAQRTASNATAIYHNDALYLSGAGASVALNNTTLLTASILNTVAGAFVGASLTSGQRTTLYSALVTYMTGVGVL